LRICGSSSITRMVEVWLMAALPFHNKKQA